MPGSGKYTTYAPIPPANPGGKGSRNPRALAKAFATPPEITDQATILATGNNALFATNAAGNQQGDLGYLPQPVNMRFNGTPDIPGDVVSKLGGGGKPMTPWTPTVASPGDGNGVDPTKIPDITTIPGPTQAISDPLNPKEINYGGAQKGVGGLIDPALAAAKIGQPAPLDPSASALIKGADPGSDPPKFD